MTLIGVSSAVLKRRWLGRIGPVSAGKVPDDGPLTFAQAQSGKVDILEEFSNRHKVDQAVTFFSTDSLIAESLSEQ